MNFKLNNDNRNVPVKHKVTSIKEERRRTGRYIAILVGISLLILAIYHAWIRRIPVVASLVVPALIMFIYVGWVLLTASRDKNKALHKAALNAIAQDTIEDGIQGIEVIPNNIEVETATNNDTISIENDATWQLSEITSIVSKGDIHQPKTNSDHMRNTTKPLILVNDELPDDFDQKSVILTSVVVEAVPNSVKFKNIFNKRRFRRKYCRQKSAVFKRSYSIA